MTREEIQKKAIQDIGKHIDYKNVAFLEIPTGTGKTKILLDSAAKELKKGRSVLVSTSNNFLALEFLKEAEKFGHDSKQMMEIVVGKDNYLNTSIALSEDFLKEFELEKKDVKKWIEEHSNVLLSQLFLEAFELPKEAEDILNLFVDEEENERSVSTVAETIVAEPKIYITNHFYLLMLLRHAKNDDFYKTPILVDEAHLLNNTARTIYKTSFSPYRLRFLTRRLIRETSVKTHIPKLIKMIEAVDAFFEIAKTKTEEDLLALLSLLEEMYSRIERTGGFEAISKLSKRESTAKLIAKEISEGRSVLKKSGHAIVSFSPVKHNPTFEIPAENPTLMLRDIVKNHTGAFVGVSGTFRVDTDTSRSKNEWSFQRLGFFQYKMPENEEYIRFNERVFTLKFAVYPRIFSKEQARFYIAKEKRFEPPKNSGKNKKRDKDAYTAWVKSLAGLAENAIWRNGLILMSSYENTEMMSEFLKNSKLAKEKGYEIFAYTYGTNMRRLVKEYKEAIDEGKNAVLIGGLNFYTGVDLHGKYLNTLFIGKLPLESLASYFSKMRVGDFSMQTDLRKNALLTFRQGIGRAIRTPDDRALIVVADPRIETKRYNIFKEFLEEYAIEIKD